MCYQLRMQNRFKTTVWRAMSWASGIVDPVILHDAVMNAEIYLIMFKVDVWPPSGYNAEYIFMQVGANSHCAINLNVKFTAQRIRRHDSHNWGQLEVLTSW